MFPVHTWLPDTTEQATTGTSVLLVCVLDKIGTFGMLRFCLGSSPTHRSWATPVVIVLAADLDRVRRAGRDRPGRHPAPDRPTPRCRHFGFIVLGIFVFTSQGGSGAILYMVNHGLSHRRPVPRRRLPDQAPRHGLDPPDCGGVEKVAPVLAGPVPGLRPGRARPARASRRSSPRCSCSSRPSSTTGGPAPIAVTAIVLAALYILWMYQRTMTGPDVESATPGRRSATSTGVRSASSPRCSLALVALRLLPDAAAQRDQPLRQGHAPAGRRHRPGADASRRPRPREDSSDRARDATRSASRTSTTARSGRS